MIHPFKGTDIVTWIPSYGHVEWSSSALAWYRDLNLMSLIGTMTSTIAGAYISQSWTEITHDSRTIPQFGDAMWNFHAGWYDSTKTIQHNPSEVLLGGARQDLSQGPLNGTLIANTHLSNTTQSPPTISFNVTQDLLNDLLLNMTLSAITTFDFWRAETTATIDTLITVYFFSQPLAFILPYSITLIISLPFILLGFWALKRNGVPATDGGFIQLVSTTTGSESLMREAAVGCLRGDTNTPRSFRDLEVRFGELVERSDGRSDVRRAGFGTSEETVPLTQGQSYGIAEINDERTGWI